MAFCLKLKKKCLLVVLDIYTIGLICGFFACIYFLQSENCALSKCLHFAPQMGKSNGSCTDCFCVTTIAILSLLC